MKNCSKCLENSWEFQTKRDFSEKENYYLKWTLATCKLCGNEVEFGIQKSPYLKKTGEVRCKTGGKGTKAEYEIRNGKHYLKIKNEFIEVELAKVDKAGRRSLDGEYLKVLPVIGNKVTLINYIHKTF